MAQRRPLVIVQVVAIDDLVLNLSDHDRKMHGCAPSDSVRTREDALQSAVANRRLEVIARVRRAGHEQLLEVAEGDFSRPSAGVGLHDVLDERIGRMRIRRMNAVLVARERGRGFLMVPTGASARSEA